MVSQQEELELDRHMSGCVMGVTELESDATELLWCSLTRIGTSELNMSQRVEYRDSDITRALAMGARVTDDMMEFAVSVDVAYILRELLNAGGNANVKNVEEERTLLSYAVSRGCVAVVDVLLAGGALPELCVGDSVTALMQASYHNRGECTVALLKAGACVNAVDDVGRTALMIAARYAGSEVVKLLLADGADPNLADVKGSTPLIEISSNALGLCLAKEPRICVADLLLRAGCDPNSIDRYNNSALLYATAYNMNDVSSDDDVEDVYRLIKLLVSSGACVNAIGHNGGTALINACKSKTIRGQSIINLLLDAGADVNATDAEGMSALMVAASCNTEEVAATLVRRGADVNKQNIYGGSALIIAASDSCYNMVAALLKFGASVDMEDRSGTTALLSTFRYPDDLWVCKRMRQQVTRLLLEAGADVNHADRDGNTALMMVSDPYWTDIICAADADEMAEQLVRFLDAGAEVNVMGSSGRSPLMDVCRLQTHRTVDMIEELLSRGADVNAVDSDGVTVLMHAIEHNCPGVVGVLLCAGADVNVVGTSGGTPLMDTCRLEIDTVVDVIRLLLDRGADINAVDSGGVTVLMHAVECGKPDVVGLLLSRGANVHVTGPGGKLLVEYLALRESAGEDMAIMLMRGGVSFEQYNFGLYDIAREAWEEMKCLKRLRHLCREKIRLCLMGRHAGQEMTELVGLLPVPKAVHPFLVNRNRYNLKCPLWMEYCEHMDCGLE